MLASVKHKCKTILILIIKIAIITDKIVDDFLQHGFTHRLPFLTVDKQFIFKTHKQICHIEGESICMNAHTEKTSDRNPMQFAHTAHSSAYTLMC